MSKFVLIFLTFAVFSLCGVALYWNTHKHDQTPGGTAPVGDSSLFDDTLRRPGIPVPSTGSTTDIRGNIGTSGASVLLNKDRVKEKFVGHGGGSYTYEGPGYFIDYYEPDNSLRVVVRSRPYGTTREKAESKLKEVTGLSEADLCKLGIGVRVDGTLYGEGYLATDFGLSFCPGSMPL